MAPRPPIAPPPVRPGAAPATPPAPPPPPAVKPPAPSAPAPAPVAPAAPAPRPSSATPGRAPINPFLANDPNAKARRLARALISDLISYFPQKKEEGLRNGTLKQLFREEIRKSYEEYVAQIGQEFAESTTHFVDALNDILAGGQNIFGGSPNGVE